MGKYNLEKSSEKWARQKYSVNAGFDYSGEVETKICTSDIEKKSTPEEKLVQEQVGFTELFRYSDSKDKILMTIGTIFAILHATGIQLNFVILADVLDKFIESATNSTTGESSTLVYTEVITGFTRTDNLLMGHQALTEDVNTKDDIQEMVPDIVLRFSLNAIGVLICGYIHMMCWTLTAERQIRVIRMKAFRSVLKQHIGWFDTQQSGELNIRLTSDIINMHSGMGDKVTTFIQWTFTFIVGTIICFIYGWELTMVMLAASPLVVAVGGLVAKFLQTFATKEVNAYASAGGVAEEALSAIRIVTAYNGHKKESERYDKYLGTARKVGIHRGFVNGLGQGVLWLLVFGVIALAFWYGNELIKTKNYSGGTIMLVQFCLFNGMRALGQAISNLENFAMARSSAKTVFQLIEATSQIDSSSEEGYKPSTLEGNIKFNNVSFRYPSRKDYQAVTDLSLELPNGKTVAMVGPSGSGKSTIVQLIQRFYDPGKGSITLDGRDLKDLNVKWLRKQIGIVQQEPVLFATTIRENIKFGMEGATQADVERAAKEANAHNFIIKLPKGYDTQVGARGGQLSGGQKQRVAIARALIRRPNILILDDATSALDYQSEAIVQEALNRERCNRTTLIIAHRLSTVRNADIICVIDQGKIQEMGTHEQLLKLGGLYYKLTHKSKEEEVEDSAENDEETLDEDNYSDDDDDDHDDGNIDDVYTNVILSGSPLDSTFLGSFGRRRSSARERKSSRASKKHESKRHKSKSLENKESIIEDEPPYPAPVSRIFGLNASEWPLLLFGSLGAILQGSIWPLLAMFASEILKAFTLEGDARQEKINEYALIIVGVGVGACLSTFFMICLFNWSGEILTERLRSMAFKAMMKQEIGWFDERKNQVGSLTSRLATDSAMVKSATGTALSTLVNAVSTVTLSVVVAFTFGWKLALVVSVFIPPLVATGMVQTKLLVGFARGSKSSVEEGGKLVSEAIDNIRTVAALSKEKYFLDAFCSHFDKSFIEGKKRSHVFGVTWGLSQSILFFAYAANYGFGAYLVSNGDMEFENVFRVFIAISTGAIELGRINAFASDYSKAKVSAGKLFALFDRVPLIDGTVAVGKKPAISCRGAVEFQNCDFRYPTRKEMKILQGLNVSINPGETLALVGPSGCGKSTTIQLLERFYDPEAGIVYLDGENVKDLDVQWLRNQIGLVAQEPTLFEATIKENIAYGDQTRDVSLEEIIAAAKMASIHNFIQELPQGYETVCGASGIQLVGGQKQRITIARAMIKNPKILLLDEATSALDTENEKIVQEALDKAQVGRTCIVIAHRLSTIENADKIAVIDNGIVVEQGKHQELMDKGGLYYQLQLIQMGAK